MRKTYLPLSDEDRNYLKSLSKKRTIQAQIVDRARILLYKADLYLNIIRECPVLKNSKNIAQKAESKQKQIRRTENE